MSQGTLAPNTTRVIGLWLAFLGVHLLVSVLGAYAPGQVMGDTYIVYDPWATDALRGGAVVGLNAAWVYPPLAIIPMVVAKILAFATEYTIAWAVLVTALNAVGFAVLIGRGASNGRVIAAGFWLAYILAHGPVGLYRIDAITVPIAVIAVLLIVSRPRVASLLLAIGAWIKVWPGVVWLAAVAVRRRARLALVVPAGVLSAAIVVLGAAIGGGLHVLSFLTEQTGRGLQVESIGALPYLWGALLGGDATVYYDHDILTFQVQGDGVGAVASLLTPLLVATTLALSALGAWRAANGVSTLRLLPPLAMALTIGLIVWNKVGSPQFEIWLVVPLVYWLVLDRRAAAPYAVAGLVVAVLTQLVYPHVYGGILTPELGAVIVITARDAVLVGMYVALVVSLVRAKPRPRPMVPAVVAAIADVPVQAPDLPDAAPTSPAPVGAPAEDAAAVDADASPDPVADTTVGVQHTEED